MNLGGILFGASALVILSWSTDLDSWVIFAMAALFAAGLILEGAFRLWDRADEWAERLYPTWELLQERADTIRELFDDDPTTDDTNASKAYTSGHRQAALRDFDMAETVGFALAIERDHLRRPKSVSDLEHIADAFDDAAGKWKSAERAGR